MGLSESGINEENRIVNGSWIALLIDDSIGAILSVPFCPLPFCPRTAYSHQPSYFPLRRRRKLSIGRPWTKLKLGRHNFTMEFIHSLIKFRGLPLYLITLVLKNKSLDGRTKLLS